MWPTAELHGHWALCLMALYLIWLSYFPVLRGTPFLQGSSLQNPLLPYLHDIYQNSDSIRVTSYLISGA